MLESRISYCNSAISFPLSLMGKKFYINSEEDCCINAIKVTSIMVKLNPGSGGWIHGGASANSAFNVKISYKKATEQGVVEVLAPCSKMKLYLNPNDAANGVNHVFPFDVTNVGFYVGLKKDTIGQAVCSALKHSVLGSVMAVKGLTSSVSFGSYVWDGLKPVFKPFDLIYHMSLVYTQRYGWRFENDDFSDVDLKGMYSSEEECRAAHSFKVFELAEDF